MVVLTIFTGDDIHSITKMYDLYIGVAGWGCMLHNITHESLVRRHTWTGNLFNMI